MGEYIGLMQAALLPAQGNNIKPPMATAWNWLENVQVAYAIFNQKLAFISAIQANTEGLQRQRIPPRSST